MPEIYARPIEEVFTIETPMGPKDFVFGHLGDDSFSGTYRGQDLRFCKTVESLISRIKKIEHEHQTKKVQEVKRKEISKNPQPAVLLTIGGEVSRKAGMTLTRTVWQESVLEDIHVRGFDQRSGDALITRADGSKGSHKWSEVKDRFGHRLRVDSGATVLLRDMDDSDRQDVLALCRTVERAAKAVPQGEWSDKVEISSISVSLHYDFDTGGRWAEYDGEVVKGKDRREVEQKVRARLIAAAGYPYGDDGRLLVETADKEGRISSYVYKDKEGWEQYSAAKREEARLREALREGLTDLLFDKTLVMVPDEPEPEPEPDSDLSIDGQSGDLIEVPRVHAPQHTDDWED